MLPRYVHAGKINTGADRPLLQNRASSLCKVYDWIIMIPLLGIEKKPKRENYYSRLRRIKKKMLNQRSQEKMKVKGWNSFALLKTRVSMKYL